MRTYLKYLPEVIRFTLPLLLFFSLGLQSTLSAEVFLRQGFDNETQDSWGYSSSYTGTGFWDLIDTELGGVLPQEGSQCWASWNLHNYQGVIEFDNQVLPLGYSYKINFYYCTKSLSLPDDHCMYALSFDNGLSWNDWIDVSLNTQIWTLLQVPIQYDQRQVKLRVATNHAGLQKYAFWDSFTLTRDPMPPTAPEVSNITAWQRMDGSGVIDVFYDLTDLNNDACKISIRFSDNNGASYDILPQAQYLSGDIGPGIMSGNAHHICWDAGGEGFELESDQYRISIHANDGSFPTLNMPLFDPTSGTYAQGTSIGIYSDTPGVTIYYSLDGSDPDTLSAVYSEPIVLNRELIIKAVAHKAEWYDSPIAEADYQVDNQGFVLVPGGTYIMGDTRGMGNATELPLHTVTVDSFLISKCEVTQYDYLQVMEHNPAQYGSTGVGPEYPVYYVSWYATLKYCNLRSMQEGLTPVYTINGSTDPAHWGPVPDNTTFEWNIVQCNWSADGYRLPTEAEWEYAARGATNNPDYLYSGSDILSDVAWHLGINDPYGAKPVGTKMPNALGIYDMSGNVYEMCWDWYDPDYYTESPVDNPKGPTNWSAGYYKVLRGGQWSNSPFYCRVSMRNYDFYGPSYTTAITGFRVCRSLPQ